MIPFVAVDQNSRRIRRLLGFRDIDHVADTVDGGLTEVNTGRQTVESVSATTLGGTNAVPASPEVEHSTQEIRTDQIHKAAREIVVVFDIAAREEVFASPNCSGEGVIWDS